jgi:hypothetical protein
VIDDAAPRSVSDLLEETARVLVELFASPGYKRYAAFDPGAGTSLEGLQTLVRRLRAMGDTGEGHYRQARELLESVHGLRASLARIGGGREAN